MPMRVRVHRVRRAAARQLVGHACVGHRPVVRAQDHAAQRGGTFALRGGGCAANRHEHEQENRYEYERASHFFQPRQCPRGAHRGRITPRFVAGAVPSLSALSVERVWLDERSYTENVLHRHPASPDREAIVNSLLVAQSHCRIHARSALRGNQARNHGHENKSRGSPCINPRRHQRYPNNSVRNKTASPAPALRPQTIQWHQFHPPPQNHSRYVHWFCPSAMRTPISRVRCATAKNPFKKGSRCGWQPSVWSKTMSATTSCRFT